MNNFVFTTQDLRKVHPPNKDVIKGLSLSSIPDAKIGVIGPNGAGKSSLQRINDGADTAYIGRATPAEGIKSGYLSQEPELDPKKTVFENVMEGVKEIKALLTRFEEVNAKFAEPMSDEAMEKLLAEQA